jgi:hypothetical protein
MAALDAGVVRGKGRGTRLKEDRQMSAEMRRALLAVAVGLGVGVSGAAFATPAQAAVPAAAVTFADHQDDRDDDDRDDDDDDGRVPRGGVETGKGGLIVDDDDDDDRAPRGGVDTGFGGTWTETDPVSHQTQMAVGGPVTLAGLTALLGGGLWLRRRFRREG